MVGGFKNWDKILHIKLNTFRTTSALSRVQKLTVNFRTPDDALVVAKYIQFYIQILSQFVKPPRDTLLRYFNIFHLVPSPSSLQFIEKFTETLYNHCNTSLRLFPVMIYSRRQCDNAQRFTADSLSFMV
jgi:hypothetical protein